MIQSLQKKPVKKALTFRASSIGDCLMGKYLLENIHAEYPDARCGIVIASRGAMIRDLFAAYSWIEVIETNRSDMRGLWKLWRRFHCSDIVVTQYAGKPGGKFALVSKLAARLLARQGALTGFADASRVTPLLYSRLVPFSTGAAPAEHERRALQAAGLSVPVPFPKLEYLHDAHVCERFGVERGKFIIVHCFAGNAGRSISPERRRELVAELAKSFPDMSVILSGAKADKEQADDAASASPRARSIAGQATLQEMMNLIDASAAVVSVDTGVAHITAQLRKPLVVLATCLGPNWWFHEQYGPEVKVTFLSRPECCKSGHEVKKYPDCINTVNISEILKAVEKNIGLAK